MAKTVVFMEPKGTILEVVRSANRLDAVICVTSDPSIVQSSPRPYDSAVGCIDEVLSIPSWNRDEFDALVKRIGDIDGVYFGVDACAVLVLFESFARLLLCRRRHPERWKGFSINIS